MNKELSNIVEKLVKQSYVDQINRDQKANISKILKHMDTDGVFSEIPNVDKIRDYMCSKMNEIRDQELEESYDEVINVSVDAINKVYSDLFTDEEIDQIVSFSQSSAGSKLLRNMDLLDEATETGRSMLVARILNRWMQNNVQFDIQQYIDKMIDADE